MSMAGAREGTTASANSDGMPHAGLARPPPHLSAGGTSEAGTHTHTHTGIGAGVTFGGGGGGAVIEVSSADPSNAWGVLEPTMPALCPWCGTRVAAEQTRRGWTALCGNCNPYATTTDDADDAGDAEDDPSAASPPPRRGAGADWGHLPRLRGQAGAPPPPPPPPGHQRWVCVSDTHSRHAEMAAVPVGDVLLHTGDLTNTGELAEVEAVVGWLQSLPHKHKVVIAGNHDTTLHPEFYRDHWQDRHAECGRQDDAKARELLRSAAGITYLEDATAEVMGYKVHGSPWQPEFCGWAFNLPRGPPCAAKWQKIPTDTDVLLTHGPPLGHGDIVTSFGLGGGGGGVPLGQLARVGCVDLLADVTQRVRPMYHVFGHVHSGYGVSTDGTTRFVNASTCTSRYKPVNAAIVFDLPDRTTCTAGASASPQ